jgi:hypothetical protein
MYRTSAGWMTTSGPFSQNPWHPDVLNSTRTSAPSPCRRFLIASYTFMLPLATHPVPAHTVIVCVAPRVRDCIAVRSASSWAGELMIRAGCSMLMSYFSGAYPLSICFTELAFALP